MCKFDFFHNCYIFIHCEIKSGLSNFIWNLITEICFDKYETDTEGCSAPLPEQALLGLMGLSRSLSYVLFKVLTLISHPSIRRICPYWNYFQSKYLSLWLFSEKRVYGSTVDMCGNKCTRGSDGGP